MTSETAYRRRGMHRVSVAQLVRDLDAARVEYAAARAACPWDTVTDRLRAASQALADAERAWKLKGLPR